MSHFAFLQPEWPDVLEAAYKAETNARPDPRTACFYARRCLEIIVQWTYTNDRVLGLPMHRDDLSARLHEPTFRTLLGQAIFTKAKVIKDLGNNAVHSQQRIRPDDAIVAVRELFHVCYWFARTYGRDDKALDGVTFDSAKLPATAPTSPQTLAQLQGLANQLRERDDKIRERDHQLNAATEARQAVDAELERLRAEISAIKQANAAKTDTHDYSEAETRDFFIDLLLREAGWALDKPQDREFEVAGMPNNPGKGFVDYVLWGDDGKPLAVVEAKRTKHDARAGQQQAKLYADCLENQFGQRPVIFCSNGYEHWIRDDASYAPRPVQGFYKKTELELLIQRRITRKVLADATLDAAIIERHYQQRAIRAVGESFEAKQRKALVVMATGAGKTRTVIALSELLMRCNWAKRVLFLADRQALVKQAVNNFKKYLPDTSPVNLLDEKTQEGRVYVSTYPTIMNMIDDTHDGHRRFGVGHFDLIIVDEAHRSVFQKYRAIFDYFDSLLVGLTATPKDEVDRNTYGLFDLETGVPTDAYALDDAVKDGYLVPPQAVSVSLKFQREGIKYNDLSETEKDHWDALEWDEDGPPESVEANAISKWFFNKNTVDKVLEHLMTRGQNVAGGDRLGKTIIFAKNHLHAEYIAERFNTNYPHFKGEFARVITCNMPYAQSLIDDFSKKEKAPHIAISVDMLDTGIDVPEVVNLVFFKLVRSKTKFYQMLGRGTRLCPDLFAPDDHKKFFYIFDFCQNLEYFSQNPATTGGSMVESVSKQLFKARLAVIGELDAKGAVLTPTQEVAKEAQGRYGDPRTERSVRDEIVEHLRGEVCAMNVDNFLVRPRRELVETFAKADAWVTLNAERASELAEKIAGLPSQKDPEPEEAKRFDLLVLKLQLMLLRAEPKAFKRLRDEVIRYAGLLEEMTNIPMVRDQLDVIQDVQADEWWQDVTVPMLESVRKRLRALIRLIEKQQRKPIYTDFEDQLGTDIMFDLPGFAPADGFERFRAKARVFLREHQDHVAIHKLRMNKELTPLDLADLEKILAESGVGATEDLQRAVEEAHGLGLFVRSLVGLDREAAKEELAGFLAGKTLSANQISFVNMIVDHLTEHGVMGPELLYESPFTDVSPQGPDAMFSAAHIDELVAVLAHVRSTAVAL